MFKAGTTIGVAGDQRWQLKTPRKRHFYTSTAQFARTHQHTIARTYCIFNLLKSQTWARLMKDEWTVVAMSMVWRRVSLYSKLRHNHWVYAIQSDEPKKICTSHAKNEPFLKLAVSRAG
jgi:hypothetical protein